MVCEYDVNELKEIVVKILGSVNLPVKSFDTLAILQSSEFYNTVFEEIFDPEVFNLEEIRITSKGLDESGCIQLLLDFLAEHVLEIELDHISGHEIRNGNLAHIKNFLQLILALIEATNHDDEKIVNSSQKSKNNSYSKNSKKQRSPLNKSNSQKKACPLTNPNLLLQEKEEISRHAMIQNQIDRADDDQKNVNSNKKFKKVGFKKKFKNINNKKSNLKNTIRSSSAVKNSESKNLSYDNLITKCSVKLNSCIRDHHFLNNFVNSKKKQVTNKIQNKLKQHRERSTMALEIGLNATINNEIKQFKNDVKNKQLICDANE